MPGAEGWKAPDSVIEFTLYYNMVDNPSGGCG